MLVRSHLKPSSEYKYLQILVPSRSVRHSVVWYCTVSALSRRGTTRNVGYEASCCYLYQKLLTILAISAILGLDKLLKPPTVSTVYTESVKLSQYMRSASILKSSST